MPDIAAGEETEDSDTVVVPRVARRGRGNTPAAESDPPAEALSPKKTSAVKMVIGGKAKPSVSPVPQAPAENTDSGEDPPPKKKVVKPVKKVIGRIGKIGGKKAVKQEDDGDDADMEDIGEKAIKAESSGPSSLVSILISR